MEQSTRLTILLLLTFIMAGLLSVVGLFGLLMAALVVNVVRVAAAVFVLALGVACGAIGVDLWRLRSGPRWL